jgi:hypothetical protein
MLLAPLKSLYERHSPSLWLLAHHQQRHDAVQLHRIVVLPVAVKIGGYPLVACDRVRRVAVDATARRALQGPVSAPPLNFARARGNSLSPAHDGLNNDIPG